MNLCAKCQLLKTIKLYNIPRDFPLMLNLFFFCYWISLLVIVNMRKMADVIQKCDIVAKRYSTNSCNSRTGTPGVSTLEESSIPLLLFFFQFHFHPHHFLKFLHHQWLFFSTSLLHNRLIIYTHARNCLPTALELICDETPKKLGV